MEIKKQAVKIGKTVYEGDIKTSAEGSIIVPDVKPDILKVLQVSAEPYLTEKSIENGKITLKGKVRVNILYLPEGEKSTLLNLDGCFEFCETVKKTEFDENMTFSAVCDANKVSYKIINSRKIGIETKILINLSVLCDCEIDAVSCEELEEAEKAERTTALCANNKFDDFKFTIEDEIKLPQGKKAKEILKCDVSVSNKEYKALAEKLVLKGKIMAGILYADSEERLEHLDYEMPFTEVFEISGLTEDSDLEVSYEVGNTEYEPIDEETLKLSADIFVNVKTENMQNVSILSDCYFKDCKCSFESETVKILKTVSKPQFSTVTKQLLPKAENAPNIQAVYRVQAKPQIAATQIQNGQLNVSGKLLVYVLYLTDSTEEPVSAIKEDIPFNYQLDCQGNVRESSKARLNIECENVSYTISSKDAVEVRCGIFISGKITDEVNEKIITDIKTEPIEKKDCGITVYFTKKNDSLWNIGKRYNVKTADILKANGITEDYVFSNGEKLIIPIS